MKTLPWSLPTVDQGFISKKRQNGCEFEREMIDAVARLIELFYKNWEEKNGNKAECLCPKQEKGR